jgi:hypothetical protein
MKLSSSKKRDLSRTSAVLNKTTSALNGAMALCTLAPLLGGVALAGPFALGVGAALGIGAAVTAWKAATYGKLASDPPRLDYDQIDRFARIELTLSPSDDRFEAALQTFLAESLNAGKALDALLVSLERQQGAEAVLKGRIGYADDAAEAKEAELSQRQALAYNLSAYSQLLTNQLVPAGQALDDAWLDFRGGALGSAINEAWLKYRRSNLSGGMPLIGDIPAARNRIKQLRERFDRAKGEYKLTEFGVTDFRVVYWAFDHLGLSLDLPGLSHLPESLFDGEWFAAIYAVTYMDFVDSDTPSQIGPIELGGPTP